jgi:hypothetical protein
MRPVDSHLSAYVHDAFALCAGIVNGGISMPKWRHILFKWRHLSYEMPPFLASVHGERRFDHVMLLACTSSNCNLYKQESWKSAGASANRTMPKLAGPPRRGGRSGLQ